MPATRAGLLLVFVVPTLLTIACDGSGPSTPTPTPPPTLEEPTAAATATPTPEGAPEAGGLDGFRAFAAGIAAAVDAAEPAYFADRSMEAEIACSGDETTGICYGQPAGAVLRGIPSAVAQSDAFALMSADEYVEMLRSWFADASPQEAPTLYAIARRPAGEGGEETFRAIVSGTFLVGPADSRVLRQQARIFDFQFLDGRWRFTGEVYASVPESAQPWSSGHCDECFDLWERWTEAAP